MKLESPVLSILGRDPARIHRINANSFQQHALTTSNGWQYAAFYTDKASPDEQNGKCLVNLARRNVLGTKKDELSEWSIMTFDDYEQSVDDGHNTISIGVCKGDGTIHVAFDHHCNELKFRISHQEIAHKPSKHQWDTSIFSKTQNSLPGLEVDDLMKEVTYPGFVNIGNDLLLTYRIGQAGAGSDILYRYSSSTHQYTYLGQHLTGISNNPYVNGIDYRLSRLHISWCYRNFIEFPASAIPDAHKQQAGPNGPENNSDFNYAFSDDVGHTWRNSECQLLADLRGSDDKSVEVTIKPGAKGARVFDIPMNSGILNQEGQALDWDGGFWALNREKVSGVEKWMVYHRDLNGKWAKVVLESASKPTEIGARGSICVDRQDNVYTILPGNSDSSLEIMQAKREPGHVNFTQIWLGSGFDGEPLVDVQRLEMSDMLSIFTRTSKAENGVSDVVVLDFKLGGE
ncbi:uncharacterized protein LY89DRAFT_704198 [Mollisia scopiformis]|uniref:Dockerin type 1 n=1 Tax=Mollisia scopiformis TaxID=149040 RepID=A0A194XQN8_MOLSC|nr:uncharacterized protein LY89DRAFT_704198 [Mollisia scopiformis]KUJ22481.1 hypothetical protein LY89DRAFT_704198 [Mollisia scopiformis]